MSEKKKRCIKVIKVSGGILIAGLVYAWIFVPAGFVVPCIFHQITGLNCPGCGVTRMCMALLHLDFYQAYTVNRGLFIALPVIILVIGISLYRYISGIKGKNLLSRTESLISAVLVVYFVIWGIVRNIYMI